MDPAAALELKALSRQKEMNAVIHHFSSPVQQFYAGATIFITGSTGFVGKQLMEKLFRSSKINRVYVLMRSKGDKNIQARLCETLKDPVYDNLHISQPDFVEKIIPIGGDMSQLELGLNNEDKNILTEKVNIIFHVAAIIRFDEPLAKATIINVRGTREIINLAKQCKKLRALVHISSAYSHATDSRVGTKVAEEFYPCPVPPDVMIQLVESLDEERFNKIKSGLVQGWPNTYSFTKSIAEEMIRTSADNLPVCIVRPSIVICTNCEPTPGWIDASNILGPSGVPFGCSTGAIHSMRTRADCKLDFIPTDLVNNAVIVAAWETDRRKRTRESEIKIYTISSSARNHVTCDYMTNILTILIRNTIVSPQTLWYCFVIKVNNDWTYMILKFFLQDIPGVIVDAFCVMMKKPLRLRKIHSTWYRIMSVLKYYINNEWIFDDHNTLELYEKLSIDDKAIYNFDVAKVNWTEQGLLWYIGLRKYILKDGLKNTEWGIKKQFYFKVVTYILGGLFLSIVCLFFYYFVKLILSYY